MSADAQRVLLQAFFAYHSQHRQTGRAGYGVAAEGAEELHTVVERVSNLPRRDDGRQGEAIADRFAEHHDIRHDSLHFKTPKMSPQSAESDLYFISDADSPRPSHLSINFRQVVRRKYYLAADAWQ